ncbi:MAG TPA: hypothetical protein VLM16_00125 [Ginsengibacter sp.]|nr:hypothetical protein [Ginsengibacter sp.]
MCINFYPSSGYSLLKLVGIFFTRIWETDSIGEKIENIKDTFNNPCLSPSGEGAGVRQKK